MMRVTQMAVLLLVAFPHVCGARIRTLWTYEELFAKADFVVIAKPLGATQDTSERSELRDIHPPEPVIGLVTEFESLLVLKGEKTSKFKLHHYRLKDTSVPWIGGFPQLVAFDPKKKSCSYLLFLVREKRWTVRTCGRPD
jgi:hypothetical protein